MKKVGHQVLFLPTGPSNLRNGEGTFLRRKDGSILFAYTAYYGDWDDHSTASISAYISYDEGDSWDGPRVLVDSDPNALNVMSASLLRMNNDDIGLFYIRKVLVDGIILDELLMRRSADEGITWSEPTVCAPAVDYWDLCNDRVIKLSTGRILMPVSFLTPYTYEGGYDYSPGKLVVYYSDDDGFNWKTSEIISSPFSHDRDGLDEPGVLELPDGRVWLFIRTAYGHQYESFSSDQGETWSAPRPSLYFTSPTAPMQVRHVKDRTVAVFNPVPRANCKIMEAREHLWRIWGRTPFALSVSEDGGVTFDRMYLLEDDIRNDYCYPTILEGDDYLLVAYYHSNGGDIALNSQKITKVMYSELTADT